MALQWKLLSHHADPLLPMWQRRHSFAKAQARQSGQFEKGRSWPIANEKSFIIYPDEAEYLHLRQAVIFEKALHLATFSPFFNAASRKGSKYFSFQVNLPGKA